MIAGKRCRREEEWGDSQPAPFTYVRTYIHAITTTTTPSQSVAGLFFFPVRKSTIERGRRRRDASQCRFHGSSLSLSTVLSKEAGRRAGRKEGRKERS